jgi:hypothetical protein
LGGLLQSVFEKRRPETVKMEGEEMKEFNGKKIPKIKNNEAHIKSLMNSFCDNSECAGVECCECLYFDTNFYDFAELIQGSTTE